MARKHLTLCAAVLLTLLACTKKRTPEFPFGEGRGLYAISEYDGKTFEVQTGKKYADHPSSVNEKENEAFGFVEYKSKSDLLPAGIALLALPDQKYTFLAKVTDSKLVIYKLGDKKTLHRDELVAPEEMTVKGSKWLAVPVLEYQIFGFFTVDTARNERNQPTNKLKEYWVSSKSQATHFRYDKTAYVGLGSTLKEQILPANYFEGTWYTTTVLSKIEEENSTFLGFQLSVDSTYRSADKVTFAPEATRIVGYNVNYDDRIHIDSNADKTTHLKEAVSIQAEWVDFVRRGQSKEEKYDNAKTWKEKRYVEVNFRKVTSEAIKTGEGEPTLTDLVIKDGFFMFSLQFPGKKLTMSFLRDDRSKLGNKYQPRRYFTEDLRYFGYFSTSRKTLGTYEMYRRDDFEKNIFINRFSLTPDPKTGKRYIRFHMTENSVKDPELIAVVKATMEEWTKAFHEAGLNDVFLTLEDERVTLGDIRYNAINLVRTLTSTSLFGYGPSIADPTTGEIISATTNVHVTSIKTSMVNQLRNYLRHARKELVANYPTGIQGTGGFAAASANDIASFAAERAMMSKASKEQRLHSIEQYMSYNKQRCDFNASAGNLIRDIETNPACQKLVALGKFESNDGEAEALEECSSALLPAKIQSTLIHEIGHNLGLRHNFEASTDEANFPEGFGGVRPRSSSVMEYSDFNEDRLTQAGPYDIEAIRFGYANAIKTKDDQIVALNTAQSIDTNLAEKRIEKKSYRFCTDEHVALSLEPLCQRHDSGTTPLAIVKSIIGSYNTLFATQNFKYDRAKFPSPNGLQGYKKELVFDRLRMIYDQWRIYMAEYVGEDKRNLSGYTLDAYNQIVREMISHPDLERRERYQQYHDASLEIFKFLKQVIFMPNRYCIVERADGKYDLKDLSILIRRGGKSVEKITCDDKTIAQLIKGDGFKFVAEGGYFRNNLKRDSDMFLNAKEIMAAKDASATGSTDKNTLQNYYDVIGSIYDRELAIEVMMGTDSTKNFVATLRGFNPTMLQEPPFREQMLEKIVERVVEGISLHDLMPSRQNTVDVFFPTFAGELTDFQYLWAKYKGSISDTSTAGANYDRSLRWRVDQTTEKTTADTAFYKYVLPNGYYVMAMSPQSDITVLLIKKLEELLSLRKSDPKAYFNNQVEYDGQLTLVSILLNVSI